MFKIIEIVIEILTIFFLFKVDVIYELDKKLTQKIYNHLI